MAPKKRRRLPTRPVTFRLDPETVDLMVEIGKAHGLLHQVDVVRLAIRECHRNLKKSA